MVCACVCVCVCVCMVVGQRCLREHVELALLYSTHHHRIVLHVEPGSGRPVWVSTHFFMNNIALLLNVLLQKPPVPSEMSFYRNPVLTD